MEEYSVYKEWEVIVADLKKISDDICGTITLLVQKLSLILEPPNLSLLPEKRFILKNLFFFAGIRPSHSEKVIAELLQRRDGVHNVWGQQPRFRSIVECVHRGAGENALHTHTEELIRYDSILKGSTRPKDWDSFMDTVRILKEQEEAYYELVQANDVAWSDLLSLDEYTQPVLDATENKSQERGGDCNESGVVEFLDIGPLLLKLKLLT